MPHGELCSACRAIFSPNPENWPEGWLGGRTELKQHHLTAASFIRAVEQGCYVCDLYSASLPPSSLEKLREWETPLGFLNCYLSLDFVIYYSGQSRAMRLKATFITSQGYPRDFSVMQATTSNQYHRQLKPFSNSGSANSLSIAKAWIQDCTSNHAYCQSHDSTSTFVPRRLLDLEISDVNFIKLVDTLRNPEANGPYIALSHCWGNEPVTQLRSNNLASMQSAISIDQLPLTFIHAIKVTRSLHVRYLWIDSLCIIQGSDDDWRENAASMGDLYSSAFCVIAATKSRGPKEGLFAQRSQTMPAPYTIQLETPDGESKQMFVVDSDYWKSRVENAPLNKRAWVMQERILGRRVLHFCYDQILFECCTKRVAEEYPEMLPEELTYPHGSSKGHISDISPDVGTFKIMNIWNARLATYSKCELTRGEDKLPAISGLAVRFLNLIGGEWHAGIFSTHFVHGLLWKTSVDKKEAIRFRYYNAPSWSWASFESGVSGWDGGHAAVLANNKSVLRAVDQLHDVSKDHTGRDHSISPDLVPVGVPSYFHELVQILEIKVVPLNGDVALRVKDGFVRILGHLIQGHVRFNESGYILGTGHETWPKVDVLDIDEIIMPTESKVQIYYAPLIDVDPCSDGWTIERHGLALVPAGKGFYRRIGVFTVSPGNGGGGFFHDKGLNYIHGDPDMYEDNDDGLPIYRII